MITTLHCTNNITLYNIERRTKHMAAKYKASEECINANDARFAIDALNEHIMNQTRRGAYVDDVKSTVAVRDTIKRVLDHASLEHDDICFIVNSGVRP
jgi:hypothetical protein